MNRNLIEETESFKKCDLFQQRLILKAKNVEIMEHTINVYKNTNYLNEAIGSKNLAIVKEILNLK